SSVAFCLRRNRFSLGKQRGPSIPRPPWGARLWSRPRRRSLARRRLTRGNRQPPHQPAEVRPTRQAAEPPDEGQREYVIPGGAVGPHRFATTTIGALDVQDGVRGHGDPFACLRALAGARAAIRSSPGGAKPSHQYTATRGRGKE